MDVKLVNHMNKKSPINALPFLPKIWASLLYFLILAVAFLLFLGRKNELFRLEFLLEIYPAYTTHISNFSIACMLVLVGGYFNVLRTGKLKYVYVLTLISIVINWVYELFFSVLNVKDTTDAIYGTVGSLVAFVYLIFFQKFGLIPNPNYQKEN